MENPKIKTKVVHSKSKPAYNVVCTSLGCKYKIAIIPYLVNSDLSEQWNNKEMDEAKNHAEFISYCFNNSDSVLSGGFKTLMQQLVFLVKNQKY